ncbi:MAG: oligosaccharide repeat unit polymerase [Polaromonas sp.]|uniref:oligosaccharide repeat unit polymerase n=1 Tax=Polaromonas sp. TaxID=1869339 RepID=UPI0027348668|nr:oligosaccharide repeat unit polymerase [Polaromonas sp.]MDP2820537.1 oligosaccharide repeat unit polymerase [Polaromonas sp.]
MYKYLIALVLGTPLIGIWLVERGEYALSVGIGGYPSGATVAYALYVVNILVVALMFSFFCNKQNTVSRPPTTAKAEKVFRQFSKLFLILTLLFLLLMLFGFGAINVWIGSIPKGEFRAGLGTFGAFPNLMTKFIVPALLAYSTLLFLRTTKKNSNKIYLFSNMAVAFLIGSTWGFKTTSAAMLLPAFLVMYWSIRIVTMLKLAGFVVFTMLIFFFIFDSEIEGSTDVFSYLLSRVTVIQGDVSWYIWTIYADGEEFPRYFPTLLAAIGDTTLTLFGLDRNDQYNWMLFHYDWMISYLAGIPLEIIAAGHSITGTPFSEGLVAGGVFGVFVISSVAGAIVGLMYRWLGHLLHNGNDIGATICATYFCFNVLPWLNGGAITQLFHISNIVGLIATVLLILIMQKRKTILNNRDAPRGRIAV